MALHEQITHLFQSALSHRVAGQQVGDFVKRLDDVSDGAKNGTGVAVREYGSGPFHMTVLTLIDVEVALTDVAATVAHGSLKLYDFPAGAILIFSAVTDLDLTKDAAGVNATWDGDFGLGTAAAAGDASLTSTEDDILPTTATPQAVAGVTTANGQSTAAENVVHDGTTTPKDLYLNVLVDDADHDVASTPTSLIFNGTIRVAWLQMGDY